MSVITESDYTRAVFRGKPRALSRQVRGHVAAAETQSAGGPG